MRIGISTIAYNQVEPLKKLIESAHWSVHEVIMNIFIHSKLPAVRQVCEEARQRGTVTVFDAGVNRGVAMSWNDALITMRKTECDVWIIVNDDVWFTDGDVDKIAQAAIENRDAYAIFCAGYNQHHDAQINCHGMSCFAMQPIALEKVGFYDQNFFPAYNEDVDYSRRAAMVGLKPFIVPDTHVYHIGSAAISTNPVLGQQNHGTHHMNNVYWQNKWGCPVSEDPNVGHRRPFNMARFHPYHIGEDERHRPFPGFNRSDQHIVRV